MPWLSNSIDFTTSKTIEHYSPLPPFECCYSKFWMPFQYSNVTLTIGVKRKHGLRWVAKVIKLPPCKFVLDQSERKTFREHASHGRKGFRSQRKLEFVTQFEISVIVFDDSIHRLSCPAMSARNGCWYHHGSFGICRLRKLWEVQEICPHPGPQAPNLFPRDPCWNHCLPV